VSRGRLIAWLALSAILAACEFSKKESTAVVVGGVQIPAAKAKAEADEVKITAANVYDHERHWPNIVALSRSWSAPGADQPLKPRHRGALVRLEPDGRARIDFGRHGVHEIPLEATDLLERTAEVRSGARHKASANFVLSVGTRLVDATRPTPEALPSIALANADAFVCVFADPRGEAFAGLVLPLAELAGLEGVGLILFPQGVADVELSVVHERLRSLSWPAPYAYPRLTPDHIRSLLGAWPGTATALLLTPEGRVLARTDLENPRAFSALRKALAG
jgi:hypothetical protein